MRPHDHETSGLGRSGCGGCIDEEYERRLRAEHFAVTERTAADAKVAAEDARREHAKLRLRFALALAADFSAFAAQVAQQSDRDGVDRPPVRELFDFADVLAIEHEQRCIEDK